MKNFTDKQKTRLIRMAFNFGENLMPGDCADIISRNFPSAKRGKYGIRKIARMIIDMMECCGFCCDRREALEACLYL